MCLCVFGAKKQTVLPKKQKENQRKKNNQSTKKNDFSLSRPTKSSGKHNNVLKSSLCCVALLCLTGGAKMSANRSRGSGAMLVEEIKDSLTTAEKIVSKLLARCDEDKVMLKELMEHISLFKNEFAHAFVLDRECVRDHEEIYRLRLMVLSLMFERGGTLRVDAKRPE